MRRAINKATLKSVAFNVVDSIRKNAIMRLRICKRYISNEIF